jgi:hypothetical protein
MNHMQKTHIFDTYGFVLTQFNTIKNSEHFINFCQISGQNIVSISNICFNCLDKLTDVSEFIEKKQIDVNLASGILSYLVQLKVLHEELIEQIYLFNGIVQDITLLAKDLSIQNINQEVLNYMNFNIIHKYKQIICKITNTIKKANVYVEVLKLKI